MLKFSKKTPNLLCNIGFGIDSNQLVYDNFMFRFQIWGRKYLFSIWQAKNFSQELTYNKFVAKLNRRGLSNLLLLSSLKLMKYLHEQKN